MAITFTGTDLNPSSRMLKVTATAGEGSIVVATRNQTTGVITSSYLSTSQLALMTSRITEMALLVANGDLSNLNYMLACFIAFSDLTGVATPLASVAAGVESLSLTGLVDNQAVYVVATVPHSIMGPVALAPM